MGVVIGGMAAVNYSSTSEQSLNTKEKRPSKVFVHYISLFLILSTGALQRYLIVVRSCHLYII